jgi:predicted dehydrogenase
MTALQTRPLGIGILGCGRIARHHAAAILALPEHARLIAMADSDHDRARVLAESFGRVEAIDSVDALLRHPQVDAVIMCTPNALHAQHSMAALSAGKHVLVEKPMADDAEDARRMAAAARQAGRILVLGQTLRHTEPIRYVQDHRAEFGRLRAVEVSMCVFWDGPQAPWWATRTPAQGLILSLFAPHALDFVQLTTGGDALTVHCEVARHQQGWQGEDEAMILLRYPGDCMASVHISYNQRFLVDRKTLHFERAFVRIENGDDLWIDDRHVLGPMVGGLDASTMGRRDLGQYFRCQLREFAAAVRGENHRSVLADEGVRLTELLDRVLATQSARRSSG